MNSYKIQQGIGLIEVMVALLLLAIAVLGFSALNMMAMNATDNSIVRVRSTTIIRNLSEELRLNPNNIAAYKSNITEVLDAVTANNSYCKAVNEFKNSKANLNCDTNNCTESQVANYNSWQVMKQACEEDVLLNMVNCPGTSGKQLRQCIIISWGDTTPQLNDVTTDKPCANASGTYYSDSECLVMESY